MSAVEDFIEASVVVATRMWADMWWILVHPVAAFRYYMWGAP